MAGADAAARPLASAPGDCNHGGGAQRPVILRCRQADGRRTCAFRSRARHPRGRNTMMRLPLAAAAFLLAPAVLIGLALAPTTLGAGARRALAVSAVQAGFPG